MIGDRIARMSNRERTWLAVAAVAVVALIVKTAVVQPVYRKFQEADRAIRYEMKRVEANQRALSPLRKQAIEREFQKYGKYLQQRSSPDEENAEMLRSVESFAQKNGISLVGTKAREIKNTDFSEEYSVEVEVEGALPGLVAFLYDLQASPELLRVERLTLTPKSKEAAATVRGVLLLNKVVTI